MNSFSSSIPAYRTLWSNKKRPWIHAQPKCRFFPRFPFQEISLDARCLALTQEPPFCPTYSSTWGRIRTINRTCDWFILVTRKVVTTGLLQQLTPWLTPRKLTLIQKLDFQDTPVSTHSTKKLNVSHKFRLIKQNHTQLWLKPKKVDGKNWKVKNTFQPNHGTRQQLIVSRRISKLWLRSKIN